MRRREVIAGLGAAAVFSSPAGAQRTRIPVVGFLRNASADGSARYVGAFRKGLEETGYIEGQNVVIDYRWTGGDTHLLPSMAADLVRRNVSVIAALGNTPAVRAAKAATDAVPIVFMIGPDPVKLGLVASLSRPRSNLTGVVNLNEQVARKWVEVIRELVPGATSLALLLNPTNTATSTIYADAVSGAGRSLGLEVHLLEAAGEREFEAAFLKLGELRASALVILADVAFITHISTLAALALRHATPAIYPFREFAMAGGLASYGADLLDAYRLAGVYTGRILKGEKPADMPVQQAVRLEMLLNLKTAAALGLTIPPALLARADEVIE